jgi:prepilin-type N-terminal cleavage/methylation domain-containing protein
MNIKNNKNGFTLLEVLAVVIIIGILAMLGWSNMNELIQTNKAKEAARTLTTFAERAIAEGKMRKDSVFIKVNGNTMEARFGNRNANPAALSQNLVIGFDITTTTTGPNTPVCTKFPQNTAKSEIRIGTSGTEPGCFVVCNVSNYCGSTVKTNSKNTFTAHIKRKNSAAWEAL